MHNLIHHNRGHLAGVPRRVTGVCVSSAMGCVLLSLAGCGTPLSANGPLRPAPTARPAPPTAAGPIAVQKAAPAPAAPLAAERFTANTARELVYDAAGGERSGTTIVLQDALPDCHCAGRSWWVRYYDGAKTGEPFREVHLTIDASGYIAQTEEIDRLDGVEVVYSPALVLVPDRLPAKASGDAAYEQEVRMVVHPLGDRSRVRTHGTATNRITFEGDERIVTGVGTFRAHRLTSVVTASLTVANTVSVSEQWLVDGIGVVVQRDREETRVMGAKVRDNASTMILRSFDAAR